ncbi:MAG: hypothetical protein BHW56_01585 [Acetobacter sp. 46_36]|jgi:signal-transduction protein with cAMP-binding, CBS, and nucleotidyltransferase domain|nr:MAG: hypothetical protein BHW56_01585 [Acetobacter sp. 46_36]
MQKFIVRVESEEKRFSDKMEGECYALNAALDEEYCREFVEKAAAESRIVLFYGEGAVKTAVHLGADGVILDLGVEGLKEKMAAVRKELGKSGVVGLFTRNRRHESMIVSEAEPDFVVFKVWKDGFESVRELTDWYNDFFLIQSAAWIMEDGVPTEELRTDFVIK